MNRREFLKLAGALPAGYIVSKLNLPSKVDQVPEQYKVNAKTANDFGHGVLYVQNHKAPPLNNPDKHGNYWGALGTKEYPVYELGFHDHLVMDRYKGGLNLNIRVFSMHNYTYYKHFLNKQNYLHIYYHTENETLHFYRTILYDYYLESDLTADFTNLNFRAYPMKDIGYGISIKNNIYEEIK